MEARKIIPKAHRRFISLVASGVTYGEAYRQHNPDKSPAERTCRSEGSRLAEKYAEEIKKEQQLYLESAEEARKSEAAAAALKKIISQTEVDARLCEIINGTLETEKIFIINGKVQVLKTARPDHKDILTAIEIFYKRHGSYKEHNKQKRPLFENLPPWLKDALNDNGSQESTG